MTLRPAYDEAAGAADRPVVKAGISRRDIAERLTLSEATVRTHLEHIYTKLNIHSARELMISNLDQLADSDTQ